jgi:hypothetical protein
MSTIDKELMVKLMNEDREYAIKKEWPLISYSDFHKDNKTVKSLSTSGHDFKIHYKAEPETTINSIDNLSLRTSQLVPSLLIKKLFDTCSDYSKKVKRSGEESIGVKGSIEESVECGIVIAGGFICNNIFGLPTLGIDIDVFFYGPPNNCEELFKKCREVLGFNISGWHRNKYAYIVYDERYKFQFIIKAHENKSQVIGNFDLNASQVLYDGHEIYFTPLSAYAYSKRCNFVDTTKASDSFLYRLAKYYHKKGFSIVLPECPTDSDKQMLYDPKHNEFPLEDPMVCSDQMKKLSDLLSRDLGYVNNNLDNVNTNIDDTDNIANVDNEISYYGSGLTVSNMINLLLKKQYEKIYFNYAADSDNSDDNDDTYKLFYSENRVNYYCKILLKQYVSEKKLFSKIYPDSVIKELENLNFKDTNKIMKIGNYFNGVIKKAFDECIKVLDINNDWNQIIKERNNILAKDWYGPSYKDIGLLYEKEVIDSCEKKIPKVYRSIDNIVNLLNFFKLERLEFKEIEDEREVINKYFCSDISDIISTYITKSYPILKSLEFTSDKGSSFLKKYTNQNNIIVQLNNIVSPYGSDITESSKKNVWIYIDDEFNKFLRELEKLTIEYVMDHVKEYIEEIYNCKKICDDGKCLFKIKILNDLVIEKEHNKQSLIINYNGFYLNRHANKLCHTWSLMSVLTT